MKTSVEQIPKLLFDYSRLHIVKHEKQVVAHKTYLLY